MTLYKKVNGNAVPWTGDSINNIRYPSNIETLWNDSDLNALGLFKLIDPGAPIDKIVSGSTISIINGNVTVVYTSTVPTPNNYPLTARQLRLGLIRNNISLNLVTSAISTLPTQQLRDEALIYWEYSTSIVFEHPMTQALLNLVGIPYANAINMWMIAKDYEA